MDKRRQGTRCARCQREVPRGSVGAVHDTKQSSLRVCNFVCEI